MNPFVVMDNAVYNFGTMEVDERGLPNPGLPPDLNHTLFKNFATWRHLSTDTAKYKRVKTADLFAQLVEEELEPMRLWLKERDVELILSFPTKMSAPFSEPREAERSTYAPVVAWATEKGLPHMFFDESMADEDVEDCLLYTSPSPRDQRGSRMPSSA